MDAELKELLVKLLSKVEGLEARLKVVESKAHDQVSPVMIMPMPNQSHPQLPFQCLQGHTLTNPDVQRYQAIC